MAALNRRASGPEEDFEEPEEKKELSQFKRGGGEEKGEGKAKRLRKFQEEKERLAR